VPNVHYIAILHDVVLAFQAQRAFGAGVGLRASFEKLIPADSFGANEVFLQIGVDRTRSFLRARMRWNLPGTALVFAGCKK
jgi:hypothetical protein